MDGSDTRRGQPAAHRRFAALHRAEGWHGDPEAFGSGAAILLGDLALSWSDEMLGSAALPADRLAAGDRVFADMRSELMGGQYLDLLEQARGGGSVERALRVARYKSAKYTIEKPLHLGAALAGAGQDVLDGYSGYGLPLGEAFQLRDDVLGVFGDPAETGKPAGDDLREGKRTALVAMALEAATDRAGRRRAPSTSATRTSPTRAWPRCARSSPTPARWPAARRSSPSCSTTRSPPSPRRRSTSRPARCSATSRSPPPPAPSDAT